MEEGLILPFVFTSLSQRSGAIGAFFIFYDVFYKLSCEAARQANFDGS